MKTGCFAIFCFVTLLATAFAVLFVLRSQPPPEVVEQEPEEVTPTTSPRSVPPTTAPLGDRYLPQVAALHKFHRDEIGGHFQLRYGFIDHHGRSHDITCDVARSDYERETARFGYDKAELNAELDARLLKLANKELQRRGLTRIVKLRIYDEGSYEAQPEFPPGVDAEEAERRNAELKTFYAWLEGDFEKQSNAIQTELFKERGFLLKNNKYYLDHGGIALRNTAMMEDCFHALVDSASGYNERQYLGLFTAFMQEIPYQLPPDVVARKQTIGLWVPTEVLVGYHGDCDSKSVTFAALWRHFDTPVVLIDLPHHMLVAVAVTPGPGENFVRIGNRYFVLCEVAGPGKFYPGETKLEGSFEYVTIPAASSDKPRAR